MHRLASTGLFLLVLSSFLLPWATVQCNGRAVEVRGVDLVANQNVQTTSGSPTKVDPEPFAIAALVCAVAGVAAFFLRSQRGNLIRALLGYAGLASVLLLQQCYVNDRYAWGRSGSVEPAQITLESGYWLATIAFATVVILEILAIAWWHGPSHLRNGWLVAMLNLVPLPLGFGYLYLRRWGRFALTLVLSIIGIVIGVFSGGLFSFLNCDWWYEGCKGINSVIEALLFVLPLVLVGAWTARDGWRVAMETKQGRGLL